MDTIASSAILNDGIIDGRLAARMVRKDVKQDVLSLRAEGIHPRVAFIRVGDDPASEVYVGAKVKACGWVGIRSEHVHLPDGTTQEELAGVINELNDDKETDAVLIQLPLPDSVGTKAALNLINPLKDVDGFHPTNLGGLLAGHGPLEPCTPSGVMRLIEMMGLNLVGKHAVVVGRSVIVGRPLAAMLARAHATVTLCHRHTANLKDHVRQADVLVVATGVTGLIRGDWIKPGAYVFDVGITRCEDGKLRGDVRFDEALERAAGITPVPGGVGPMTIARLLENTVRCARLVRGLQEPSIHRA